MFLSNDSTPHASRQHILSKNKKAQKQLTPVKCFCTVFAVLSAYRLERLGKLIGTGCALGAASYALQLGYGLVDLHALYKAGYSLKIAVAASYK